MRKGRKKMVDAIRKISYENSEIIVYEGDQYLPYQGGNKARKIMFLKEYLVTNNYNAIVTTGGIQSNHCRVTALFAAQMQMPCTLVLHGCRNEFFKNKGNALLMRMTDAELVFVESAEIGSAMDAAISKYEKTGYKPYYLYGGGHNKEGVDAYIEITKSIITNFESNRLPHHIFLASGTGSTQAGIVLGMQQLGLNDQIKVHGISVGKTKQNGINAINHAISFVDTHNGKEDILFYDDYLFGGYGKGKESLMPYINDVAKKTGLILDPNYTGKAFYGMMDQIKKQQLKGNLLFWHTGGIFKLME